MGREMLGSRFLPLAAASLLLAAPSGAARAAACVSPHAPDLRVEMRPADVAVDETLGLGDLLRLDREGTLTSADGRVVFGLTESRRDARVSVAAAPPIADADCAALARVRVVITPLLRVHIAREAAADPCFRQHVLAHELRHVAIERRFAAGEADYVRSRLAEFAASLPGRRVRSDAGRRALTVCRRFGARLIESYRRPAATAPPG